LVTGMAAWVVRYFLFASAASSGSHALILLGILLHGICYDFFFVTGQVYIDQKSSSEIRGQAQGFLVLVTYGVGMLLGAQISGWVFNAVVPDPAVLEAWRLLWILPGAFAAAVLAIFALGFPTEEAVESTT
ncbi:MAG: MFS transporter, partial [Vicinamibacteria bacterium]